MTTKVYRQGDVLIREMIMPTFDVLSYKKVPKSDGRVVLAFGEVTGHSHAFDRDAKVTMFSKEGMSELFQGPAGGRLRPDRDRDRDLVHGIDSDPLRAPELRRFIEVDQEVALLVHEEHGTIHLPRGFYEVVIQREYHPTEIRRVED